MKKTIFAWIIRLIVIGLVCYFGYKWGKPVYTQYFVPKKVEIFVPTTKVKEGPFVVSFTERGNLKAVNSSNLRSEINGKIIQIVKEGQLVKTGDTIAVLDPTQLKTELQNQELEYENRLAEVKRAETEMAILQEANKTELAQSQADLDFNKSELDRAKSEFEKKKRLAADKLIPTSDVDSAEIQVKSKELAVLKGTMSLELKKKDIQAKESQKGRDIRNVNFRASMSKSQLEEARSRVKNTKLISPASGLIVLDQTYSGAEGRRSLQSGDTVVPQQSICTIPDLSSMEAKVKVGEGDVSRLKLGMAVRLGIEALPGRKFKGSVKEISTLASEGNPWEAGSTPGKKTFEVSVILLNSDPRTLRPGMTVQAEFINNNVAKAVYVPIEAVLERGGATWVYVKEGNGYRRAKVFTGLENDNNVIVKKGLKAGQIIALKDPSRPGKPVVEKNKKTSAPMPTNGKG